LKTGCFSCLGVIAVSVLVLVVIAVVALVLGPPERKVERPEVTRELPVAPRREAGRPEPGPDAPTEAWAGEPGRVVLDVSMGRFEVVAGEPGDPIRVEGSYDSGSYELTESLEREGETGWVYRLTFGRKVSWIRELFSDHTGDNLVRLVIPREAPIVLEGKIGIGESELELGGLWLIRTDLDLGVGEHHIEFDEPSPLPMERFRVGGSVGEIRILRLGNASPRSVWVSSRIGAVDLDLRGRWQNDSEVVARGGIGEFVVRIPDDVSVVVDKANVRLGDTNLSALHGLPPAGEGVATLSLEITGGIGELRIDR
jgi:hypothetical protein